MASQITGFGPYLDGSYDASLQVQLNAYERTTAHLSARRAASDAMRTPEDVRARQEALRAYADGVLDASSADRPAPTAIVTGTVERPTFVLTKLVLETGPTQRVTANLYLPRDTTERTGAVLFLCGHADAGKAAARYQAFCARLASNGLVVMAIDSIGQGERKSYLDAAGREEVPANVVEHSHAGVQCWWTGDTIARYFVDDARRAIDYLCTRPEVDPARIGVAGNSGGSTQATWLMLIEPRIAAAALGCFITSRQSYQRSGGAQDAEQILPGGALIGIDHEDFLIAMAPRPVLVMSANSDFFPVEGAHETVERARRAYEILGKPESLGHVRADHPHGLMPELAKAGAEFLVRHLGNEPTAAIDSSEPVPIPEAELLCTASGRLRVDYPDTPHVFELNQQRLLTLRTARSSSPAQWLTDQVHRQRRTPSELFPRWSPAENHRLGDVEVRSHRAMWWSEIDVLNAGVLVEPADRPTAALEIACFATGSAELADRTDWLTERVAGGVAVLALDVRGTGALTPHEINPFPLDENYGTLYKLMTDLIWLGDSLAAARVFDILRAVELIAQHRAKDLGDCPIRLFGAGPGAFLGYLAAAIEPRIQRIELESPPLDPTTVVDTRMHGPQSNWQHVIPGMAVHCGLEDLLPLFNGRDLHIPQPAGADLAPTRRPNDLEVYSD
ncbi:alpha/beta hydrolase family protein [Ruania alba]|uniref:Acetyl xylan esterase (AXE1) n=1 Tax=Ruania alba TaxID=648782 RepID=A0A1H5N1Q1_9MICO|nr:acetylxylan esterase [Ruania alba]SEE95370.1 Acetyl xylan esterase (AXE1) [Ruania alba]